MKQENCKIPTWALPYLVNGDVEGMEEQEVKVVTEWEKLLAVENVTPKCDENGHWEVSFDAYPVFGLPCEVVECEVLLNSIN